MATLLASEQEIKYVLQNEEVPYVVLKLFLLKLLRV